MESIFIACAILICGASQSTANELRWVEVGYSDIEDVLSVPADFESVRVSPNLSEDKSVRRPFLKIQINYPNQYLFFTSQKCEQAPSCSRSEKVNFGGHEYCAQEDSDNTKIITYLLKYQWYNRGVCRDLTIVNIEKLGRPDKTMTEQIIRRSYFR